MKILDGIIQGENSWHLARAKYRRTASLAPAIMGSSKKKSRTEVIAYMATGVEKEFSQWVQENLLDRGLLIEAYAKPLAEKIIGKKLYPITAISDDEYMLASYDGLSADDEDAWECKSWNEKKAEDVRAGIVPSEDLWQVVQQLAIGANRCLYMVTDGTEDRTEYCWLLREEVTEEIDLLIAGWNQADKDVANYQHIEHIEKPKAEVCIKLPALFVHARGEITTHNMQEFGEALQAKLEEVRAIALVTDQDFSNAKAAAKMFRDKAKEIKVSKESMLSQTVTIGEAARMMDAWSKDLNETALKLEKDVEREDLAKKRVMVGEAGIAFSAHVEALESETRPIQLNVPRPDFAVAIKNKRTYASMQGALDDALAQGRIDADAIAKDVRAKLAWCKEHAAGMSFLFPDLQQVIVKPFDDFRLTVTTRIEAQQKAEAAKLEAERVHIQAEEEAKAKAAQDALLSAERANMEADVIAKAKAENDAIVDAMVAKKRAEIEAAGVRTKAEQEAARIAVVKEFERTGALDKAIEAEQEAAVIEERRKQAQLSAHIKPVKPLSRPSDKDIINAVAAAFGISYGKATDWICEVAEVERYAA